MILNLIENRSSNNTINKDLLEVKSYNIALRADVDLKTFDIVVKDDTGEIESSEINYCEIEELSRFYFINNIDSLGNGFYRLFLQCDVLETYKAEILQCNARFTRSIKTGDYIEGSVLRSVNSEITLHNSDKGFDGVKSLVLSTIGAGA